MQKVKNLLRRGNITVWNDEKGFGFITPNAGGDKLFFHIKSCITHNQRPEINQSVTYSLSVDKQGRTCATKVTLPHDDIPLKNKKTKGGIIALIGAALFIAAVCISVFAEKIPPVILGFYLVVSLLTFIVYARDKSAAQKGAWRTPENTLHLLSIIGGWPGALIAQQKLRHKSQKQLFRFIFWITVLMNCGALSWLFTPTGAAALQSFMVSIL
jgi:uncharacterized membrane protein YsdA (DUF1294 family)/cold shock CspA family protein